MCKELGENLTDEELQVRPTDTVCGGGVGACIHMCKCKQEREREVGSIVTYSLITVARVSMVYYFLDYLFVFQEMIDEADKDGDGEVSEAEFLRIMKKTNMY